jgi:hypothetical protein
MTEAAKRKTRKPAKKLTAVELMKTPRHMLAWLQSMPARSVVTRDLLSDTKCLGANFIKAQGCTEFFGDLITSGAAWGKNDWFGNVINELGSEGEREAVTAQRAIRAIKSAS